MEVVAELERGDEIMAAALRTQPDVAVLDIGLPGLDGLAAAEQLHDAVPDCRVLVLTGRNQPGTLLRALQVHVRGFIAKDAPAQTLASGIRRETDVLREAESGISTEEIGGRLSLSPATVRNYLSNAISKVGARNRIDAIRIARDAGWL